MIPPNPLRLRRVESCIRFVRQLALTAALVASLLSFNSFAAETRRTNDYQLFARTNLVAWCIVPFDSRKRGPEERAEMLSDLGISKLAYDYRAEHIPTFDAELNALKKRHLELVAWWFPGALNDEARLILDVLKRHNVRAQLWITGSGGPVATEAEQKERVRSEAERLRPIAKAADEIQCSVALYNHGHWFGEPTNQIQIITALREQGITNVGIVYNQHHGHDHIDRFAELLSAMKPYLLALNLNGMTVGGDQKGKKILPIGQGDLDPQLLRTIRDSGWRGPIGILNHTDEDAKERLLDNLEGLEWAVAQLDGQPAARKPTPRSWRDPSAASGTGEASLSPAFGAALHGGLVVESKPAYRSSPLTVECRARLDSKNNFNILVASDPKNSAEHWELYTFAGTGVLSLYLPGRGGNISAEENVCDGQWHYFAATIEADRVRLFVDGRLVKEAPIAPLKGERVPGGLAIGRLVEGGIGCDGVIDEVRLSAGLRQIAGIPRDPFIADAATIGLWNFEDLKPRNEARRDPWAVEDASERAALPEFYEIPAALPQELTRANGFPRPASMTNWHRSLGDATASRYSAFDQINRNNVAQLEVAWTYHSKDGAANIQCNPIVVDGVMYAPTAGHFLAAVDAETGIERWRFQPEPPNKSMRQEDIPARRGLIYWPGDAHAPARLLFTCGDWIYAVNALNGTPIKSFGRNGRTSLPQGGTVAGAIFENLFIVPGYRRDVFGYDLRSGELVWTFHTIPQAGEYGADTWAGGGEGANCWGGMALDEQRGIAFVSTGSPKPNFYGGDQPGDNLFANCVIALDARTGKRLWHFQEIRHDIWDLDIPAPPNLITVTRDGLRVDAVAQVTKLGNTLLLDRGTGKPLFPVRMKRAPVSRLPGEWTAPYQPDLVLPEPFARNAFGREHASALNEDSTEHIRQRIAGANLGWFEPFTEGKPTVLFNIHGGAEWTGAAVDPVSGYLYVSANEIPWAVTVFRDDPEPARDAKNPTPGERHYAQMCASCHGADRVGVGVAPPLRGLRHRMSEEEALSVIQNGKNLMPAAPSMSDGDLRKLMDFLFVREQRENSPPERASRPAYTFNGYPKLLDQEGYPGCKPPWGTLNCIDLNTGKIRWKVPLGEYEELTAQGIPQTGTENFGGATVTAGGLVFCSGTRDRKIRAFDSATGKELWSHALPLHGTTPPTVYQFKGRQYVVLPATGGGKLGGEAGDAYVAFALPKTQAK